MEIKPMANKRILFCLLAALLIFALAACVRPASRPPSGEATATGAEGGFPVPGTQDVMGQLEGFATQTALALQGGGTAQTTPVAPGEGTPVEGTPTGGDISTAGTPAAGTTPGTPVGAAASTPEAPAAPTNTPAPIPPLTVPETYKLRGGEFPYCIARRFNVNPSELLSLNGLGPNSATFAGTTLKIPTTGNPFPGDRSLKAHPTTYTVRAGDTVYSIACQFGDVDPNAILAVNGLGEAKELSAGQTLQIP